jgi:signal transduction histidine kinase
MTIRTTLTIRFSVLVASILLVFSLAIYFFYARYREQEFYDRLREKALTTVHLLEDVSGIDVELLRSIDRNDLTALYKEEVTIYNAANHIIYDSGNEPYPVTPGFLRQVREGEEVHLREGQVEVLAVRYRDKRNQVLAIVAYAVDRYGWSKLKRLGYILAVGWVSSVLMTLLAGRYFAGKALRPVSSIVRQVKGISASNINDRLQTRDNQDELTQLAQTFNDMLARLEEAFMLQKSFVAHASHELRTPLAVITSQIEVARLHDRNSAEYQAILDSVLEEVRSMNELSNGLLEMARVNADAATIPLEAVRADELLWQARSELLKKLPDYGVDIDFEELPEAEEDLVVRGNALLLKRAFLNVMENGCKYSRERRVAVTILARGPLLAVSFRDRGTGIAPEDLPHVFEPFYRSESNGHIAGHGIGLPLTYRIVQLHGGEIRIDSTVGQGTTVRIILPLPVEAGQPA